MTRASAPRPWAILFLACSSISICSTTPGLHTLAREPPCDAAAVAVRGLGVGPASRAVWRAGAIAASGAAGDVAGRAGVGSGAAGTVAASLAGSLAGRCTGAGRSAGPPADCPDPNVELNRAMDPTSNAPISVHFTVRNLLLRPAGNESSAP